MIALSALAAGTPYEEGMIPVGMICISLALPLGRIEYPIRFKNKGWKENYAVGLIGFGLITLLLYLLAPVSALTLFLIYLVAFIVYNWSGAFSR